MDHLNDKDSVDKELERLYAKAQDELTHIKSDNTVKTLKSTARDVIVHLAVTIEGNHEGHHVLGEKDNEIGQFAVRIPARWMERGLTMVQCKKLFEALSFSAMSRMRIYGLTRE